MKRSKPISFVFLAVLVIIGVANIASAVTWGVCNGDGLKYDATYHIDNQFITSTTSMNVTFNVTYVGDYVTANMSEDGGAAVSVFLNTQSLDPDYGINIKTTNWIDIRYIADEQRFQAQMTQINNSMVAVLANFSMSRGGNSLYISAYGSGTGTSWTYDAEIHYTSDYVLSSMSEDLFQTDGINDAVQNVLWTKAYHHSTCTPPTTTPTTTPTTSSTATSTTPAVPELLTPIIIGAGAVFVVVVVIIMKRR